LGVDQLRGSRRWWSVLETGAISLGAPGAQSDSWSLGASVTIASLGPFVSNGQWPTNFEGTINTVQINLGVVGVEVDYGNGLYDIAVLPGLGKGYSIMFLTTVVPAGSTSRILKNPPIAGVDCDMRGTE